MSNLAVADALVGLSVDITRFDAATRKRALEILRGLERDLLRELRLQDPTGVTRTRYQQARLEELLAQTRISISKAYGNLNRSIQSDLRVLSGLTAEATQDLVNAAVKFDVMTTGVSPTLLEAIARDTLVQGTKAADWWSRQAGDTRFRFEQQMRDGVLRGETVGQLQRRVRNIMPVSRRNAEGLARTAVINVSNEAALQVFKENDDVVEAIEWVSTLDSRTTEICRALDGLKWSMDGYKPIGHDKAFPGATAHWACRSTQVPVLYEADKLPPSKRKGANKVGYRASAGGPVSAEMDYDAWLRRLDKTNPTEAASILGAGRYKLWKAGKITSRDLTDSLNRPLTLAQLQAKYGRTKPRPKVVPIRPAPAPVKKPTVVEAKRLTQKEIALQRLAATPKLPNVSPEASYLRYQIIGKVDELTGLKTAEISKELKSLNLEKTRQVTKVKIAEFRTTSYPGELAKEQKILDELEAKAAALEARLAKEAEKADAVLDEVWNEIHATSKDTARKYVTDRLTFKIGKRKAIRPGDAPFQARDDAIEHTTGLAQIFGAWVPDGLRNVISKAKRAYAVESKQLIDVGIYVSRGTVFHEIGHFVEHSDGAIYDAAVAFRAAKATADKPTALRFLTNVNYSLKEKALPGDFLDPYVGKVYSQKATEVVSMGLEQFRSKEAFRAFALAHPDHFQFMLGVIRDIRYR